MFDFVCPSWELLTMTVEFRFWLNTHFPQHRVHETELGVPQTPERLHAARFADAGQRGIIALRQRQLALFCQVVYVTANRRSVDILQCAVGRQLVEPKLHNALILASV